MSISSKVKGNLMGFSGIKGILVTMVLTAMPSFGTAIECSHYLGAHTSDFGFTESTLSQVAEQISASHNVILNQSMIVKAIVLSRSVGEIRAFVVTTSQLGFLLTIHFGTNQEPVVLVDSVFAGAQIALAEKLFSPDAKVPEQLIVPILKEVVALKNIHLVNVEEAILVNRDFDSLRLLVVTREGVGLLVAVELNDALRPVRVNIVTEYQGKNLQGIRAVFRENRLTDDLVSSILESASLKSLKIFNQRHIKKIKVLEKTAERNLRLLILIEGTSFPAQNVLVEFNALTEPVVSILRNE